MQILRMFVLQWCPSQKSCGSIVRCSGQPFGDFLTLGIKSNHFLKNVQNGHFFKIFPTFGPFLNFYTQSVSYIYKMKHIIWFCFIADVSVPQRFLRKTIICIFKRRIDLERNKIFRRTYTQRTAAKFPLISVNLPATKTVSRQLIFLSPRI